MGNFQTSVVPGHRLAMGVAGHQSEHDRSTGGGLPLMVTISRIILAATLVTALTGSTSALFALTSDPKGAKPTLLICEEEDQSETVAGVGAAWNAEDPTCGPRIPIADSVFRKSFRVTAYCDRGITAAGIPSGYGQCAAPADVPFGSRVYIPELGQYFIVTDRTHRRFRHNTIDVFIPSRADCLQFGRRTLICEIEVPAEPVAYASPALPALIASRWP